MKWKKFKPYGYLLPSFLIISLFQVYPLIKVFTMSFYTKFNYIKDEVYEVGLDNFKTVLTDEGFYKAIYNTFKFVLMSVPLSIIISLLIAVLLNKKIRFKKLFTSIYFIPFVTSTVAMATVWKWIFHSEFGLLNLLLNKIGLHGNEFLTDSNWTMPMLVLISLWKGLGYKIIIFLAGLQNIDEKYYLAAKIDGASKRKSFFHITLPLLMPSIFFVSITTTIGCFKIFDEIFILYNKGAGPLDSGLTIVYYVFDKFYMRWQFATASAAAFILFIIIAVFTYFQFKVIRRFKYYEE